MAQIGNVNASAKVSHLKSIITSLTSIIKNTIFSLSALTENSPSSPEPKIETKENQWSHTIDLDPVDSLLINFQLV
jgi:hypothetical protein